MFSYDPETVDEVLSLLRSVEIRLDRVLEVAGREGSAAIIPLAPPGPDGRFVLAVRFFGSGHLAMDWSGIGVRIDEAKDNGQTGNRWFGITGPEGKLDFETKLAKGVRFLRVRTTRETVLVGQFPKVAALNASAGAPSLEKLPSFQTQSADSRLLAEAKMYPGGRIEMAIEGTSPDHKNAEVLCEVRPTDGSESELFDFKMDETRGGRALAVHAFPEGLHKDAVLRLAVFRS